MAFTSARPLTRTGPDRNLSSHELRPGTGVWSAGTLTTGDACIEAGTVGDSIEFEITGSCLNFEYVYGNAGAGHGKFEVWIDGVLDTTINCWVLLSADFTTKYGKDLTQGQHFVRLVVVAKDAASASNVIKVGKFSTSTDCRFSTKLVHVAAGAASLPTNARSAKAYKAEIFPGNLAFTGQNAVIASNPCVVEVFP
ncbi:hypothetical protein BH10PSE16_BH10PSE16_43750 [soil metagenome]